jgi:hypothetical protein
MITSLYAEMRDTYGFYPEGVGENEHGERVMRWGLALKSDLQIFAEKNKSEHERRGKEVMEERGGFSRAMENRRITGGE